MNSSHYQPVSNSTLTRHIMISVIHRFNNTPLFMVQLNSFLGFLLKTNWVNTYKNLVEMLIYPITKKVSSIRSFIQEIKNITLSRKIHFSHFSLKGRYLGAPCLTLFGFTKRKESTIHLFLANCAFID